MFQPAGPRLFSLLLFCCLLVPAVPLAAAPPLPGFSTEPPAVYTEKLAALLTPAELVLATAKPVATRAEAGEDGSILLLESVIWVSSQGITYRILHTIRRANTEAVVNDLGRDQVPFQPSSQKAFLVLARTLPPGGEWQNIRPDAAFVQSPQEDADRQLFTDRAELVIVYPQIKVGSVTEYIFLLEEPEGRIPGQLTSYFYFSGTWSSDIRRSVVEVPSHMAARLKYTPIGELPPVQRLDLPEGRSRFTWELRSPPILRTEPRMAPGAVLGPALFLTTLESWQDLADWYRGLLSGRDELSPALRAKAEEWTREAKTPREVAFALHRHVADEIRYTGLEFGIAGFQPKTPAEVWDNLYGDCKDKANLLRALLAAKGIPSHLALVNTDHRGQIEERSPDSRHFDHAILAIELPGDELLWADPTIPYLDPGELGPGSGDRQALLITTDGWRFAKTSKPSLSRLRILADLEVNAGGALEGFLELDAHGFTGSAHRQWFEGDQNARLRTARQLLRGFFSNATVIDVAAPVEEVDSEPGAGRSHFRARIYFTVDGTTTASSQDTLRAPNVAYFENQIDQPRERRSEYPLTVQDLEVELRYQLPDGWATRELPTPFEVEVPALLSRGSWSCEKGACRVLAQQKNRLPVVTPGEFAAFLQAKKAFDAWLRRPLVLEHGEQEAGNAVTATLNDFPLMPTGEGQLRLLDHKFPQGRQDNLRRAAIDKILQWFPDDETTQFRAGLQRGLLDCGADETDAEQTAAGAERLRQLLRRHEKTLPANELGWGRFLLASCPGVSDEESLPLLRRNADDPGLHPVRQGFSLLLWAEKLEATEIEVALELYRRAMTLIEKVGNAGYTAVAWAGKVRLLAVQDDPTVASELEKALTAGEEGDVASHLATSVEHLAATGNIAAADRLLGLLEGQESRRPELKPLLAELRQARDQRASAGVHAEIARELAALFADSPPAWWSSFRIDTTESAEAAAARLAKLESEPDIAAFVRQAVYVLTTFPPGEDFSHRLHQLGWCFSSTYPESELTPKVLRLGEKLPKSDNNRWEILLERAAWEIGRGRSLEASRIFEEMLADPELPADYTGVVHGKNFEAALAGERFDEAASLFARFEPHADFDYFAVLDSYLRGALLALEQGRLDEGWQRVQRLAEVKDEAIEGSASPALAAGLKYLAADEQKARQLWQAQQVWWPAWQELGKKLGLPEKNTPITELVEPAGLDEKVRELMSQNQPRAALEALVGLAHAARWESSLAVNLADVVVQLANSQLGEEVFGFQILLLEALPPARTKEAQAEKLMVLGSALLDHQRPLDALAPFREILAMELDGNFHRNAASFFAAAAADSGESREEARDQLLRVLDDSFPRNLRSIAVTSLADLYNGLGQTEEARKLLEREVQHPVFAGSPELAELQDRLAASRHGGSGDLFDLAFQEFRQRFPLPILTLAEPATIDDPRVAGKKFDALSEGDWLPAEKVKLIYLIAADGRRPVAERSSALAKLPFQLDDLLPNQGTFREMMGVLAADERFPAVVRTSADFGVAVNWAIRGNLARLEEELARGRLTAASRFQDFVKNQRDLLLAHQAGAEGLDRWLGSLLQKKLTEDEADLFQLAYVQLIQRHGGEAAQRLAPRLAKLETVDSQKAEDLLFEIERAFIENEEHYRVLTLLRSKRPAAAASSGRPQSSDEVAVVYRLLALSKNQCHELLFHELKDLSLGIGAAAPWVHFYLLCGERGDGSARFGIDLLEDILALELRDETLAQWVFSLGFSLGDDDPLWPEMLEKTRAAVDPVQEPETARMLRVLEVARLARSGAEVNFEAEREDQDSLGRSLLLMFETDQLLHERDRNKTKTFLSGLGAAELKDENGILNRLKLARLLPESPETKLVERAARRHAYEKGLDALATCNWMSAALSIRLLATLDDKNTYSQEFFDQVLGCQQSRVGRAVLELADAEARKDWAKAYTSAKALIEFEPLDHDDQFNLGRAAFQIGKKDEARAALSFLLSTVKNNPDVPEARKMLENLAAGGN